MTLIDKLEHLEKEFLNKERDNTSSIMTLIASATASGVSKAINIVKEHSEYVSVDDTLPDEGVKVLAWHSRKEKFFIATYDRELKVWLNDGKPYSSEFLYSITHWMSLPSSPSEV